ncbi:Glycosylphosphatidylinositol protein transamidase GAA1 component [Venturia nashicola]|uniref:Glycosylphosphatidylinositol protein transamidase GAA1 component n=1 Tax=Venturia nashicola TaxID=86259 RepID=A0A4Z1NMU2_9PEZI|nr:glycosylphosphatidylinositol protein transamidase GAA1 component [Venturia nashicola]TLD19533.1 Glycosylphosphatidylinositol protein transamidase GAA1 component [Venturia nashicola]
MAAIANAILALRKDKRILKIPPYLSALLILVGVAWLLLLPLNQYSRSTYVSENALLPGQVHTYFGGSEHNIFRAYRQEVATFEHLSGAERVHKIGDIFKDAGLKVATQRYNYEAGGSTIGGDNVYAVLQGPRADATEAIVLIAAWRNMKGEINYSGVALLLTLARFFKRWSLWSKDIIFLITEDSTAGSQAWVDAYHDAHNAAFVESLSIKSGALQGAVAIDYPAGPWGKRFDKLHLVYDGINGQLPNLDLFNTAVSVASGQMGIGCTLQRMWDHNDEYADRLQTMLRGMLNQGLGHATGPHSSFIPYHVDAITIETVGDGWHDEMSLGRTVEGLVRSLNNLLEHLHQSFFFYLLMQANRFVSIGTYLPSAMLVAGSFSIVSIALWVQSGRGEEQAVNPASTIPGSKLGIDSLTSKDTTLVKEGTSLAIVPAVMVAVKERHFSYPLILLTGLHFLGLLPLYLFNHTPLSSLTQTFITFTLVTLPLPTLLAAGLPRLANHKPTKQELMLLQCFCLLLLGLFLSALATLNFSLSLIIGVFAAPYSFIRPSNTKLARVLQTTLLILISPPVIIIAASALASQAGWVGVQDVDHGGRFVGGLEGMREGLGQVLAMASTGWWVHGLWTSVVIWLVWWPGWLCASFVAASRGV